MQTLLQDAKRTKRLALAGAFLCAALMLSLAESIMFPAGILPIPGAKPGFANAAILLCAVLMGRRYAASVLLARVLLMFILFGNATSILYSLAGGIFSFAGIALFSKSLSLSFIGKSVISAILHNTGQIICAVLVIGKAAVMLFPLMILSSILCGAVTGFILNLCYTPVYKYCKRSFMNTEH